MDIAAHHLSPEDRQLVETLVGRGWLNPDELAKVALAVDPGGRSLGRLLVEEGVATEAELLALEPADRPAARGRVTTYSNRFVALAGGVDAPVPGPGQALGAYVVRGQLSSGAVSLEDPATGRCLCAWALSPGASAASVTTFVAEARILGQLRHPVVPPVIGLERTPDGWMLRLEPPALAGASLGELIGTTEAVAPLVRAVEAVAAVADGVAFAHSRGVAHGGLRAEAVTVAADGQVRLAGWHAAVSDPSAEAIRADLDALGALLARLSDRPDSPWQVAAMACHGYTDAAALRDDLHAFVSGGRIRAPRYPRVARVRGWFAARKVLLCLIGLAVGGLAATGLAARWERAERGARADRAAVEASVGAAGRLLVGAPAVEELEAAASWRRADPRRARFETLAERASREDATRAYLGAVAQLESALARNPGHRRARQLRRHAGERLARVAEVGGDHAVAAWAYRGLRGYGWTEARVAAALAALEATSRAASSATRGRWSLALDRLARDDARAQDLALARAEVDRGLDPSSIRLFVRRLDELTAVAGPDAAWSPGQRRVARLCGHALGSLGAVQATGARATSALARWVRAVHDEALMVAGARALCLTGSPAAYAPLAAARGRLGADSEAWGQIAVFLDLVPEPRAITNAAPETVKVLLARGRMRLERRDRSGALRDAQRAVSRASRNADAHHLLGDVRAAGGAEAAAVAAWDAAIALDAAHAPARVSRGRAALARGDARAAVTDLERAVAGRAPPRASWLTVLGRARLATGDAQGAVRDLDAALALRPRSALATRIRAEAHERLGQPDAALADRDRVIALQALGPGPAAYHARSALRLARRDHIGALEDADRALALDGGRAGTLALRGQIRLRLGSHAGAVADLTRSLRLAVAEPWRVYALRAAAKAAAGDPARARADLVHAVELAPAPERPALQARIRALDSDR